MGERIICKNNSSIPLENKTLPRIIAIKGANTLKMYSVFNAIDLDYTWDMIDTGKCGSAQQRSL